MCNFVCVHVCDMHKNVHVNLQSAHTLKHCVYSFTIKIMCFSILVITYNQGGGGVQRILSWKEGGGDKA